MANAVLFFLNNTFDSFIYNVGSGEEISIFNLAKLIQNIIGHKVEIIFDRDYPDGTPKKLLDSEKIHRLGLRSIISREDGIKNTYNSFLDEKTK